MDLVETTTTTIRCRIGSRKIIVFIWMQWEKCLIVYQSDFLSLSRFPQPDKQDSCIMTQKQHLCLTMSNKLTLARFNHTFTTKIFKDIHFEYRSGLVYFAATSRATQIFRLDFPTGTQSSKEGEEILSGGFHVNNK